ncbi:MAG TPA: transglutaminase domain-containing protein, partial [Chitinophaga sp.]
MLRSSFFAGLVLLVVSAPLRAQEKNPYQFGKISPEDFKPTRYALDTGASAVYLADVGQSYHNDRSGDLEMVFKHYTRIHILRKSGYDAADFEIHLYQGGADGKADELTDLKAVTYNLENGQVVATKLDSKSVFTEKEEDGHWALKKFSMPAVKEGSIVEVSYTRLNYVDRTPPSWDFQGYYPRVWSEYEVSIPQWYSFVFLRQGYYDIPYKSKDKVTTFAFNYQLSNGMGGESQRGTASAGVTDHIFTAHNLPGLRDESFTTTLRNHVSRIEFQLASVHYPDSEEKKILATWPQMQEEMFKDETFGAPLTKENYFLDETIKTVTAGARDDLERARALYAWVQRNFTCTERDDLFMKGSSLRQVFNSRRGNSTDINLLLVALYKQAGLDAWPLILSTRHHGKTYEQYPIHRRFNYTIAWVRANGKEYTLDASLSLLGFGQLPLYCYNGHARLMSPEAPARYFYSDSLKESTLTSVRLSLLPNGNLEGAFSQQEGYHQSLDIRQEVKEHGIDAFLKTVQRNLSPDAQVSNLQL